MSDNYYWFLEKTNYRFPMCDYFWLVYVIMWFVNNVEFEEDSANRVHVTKAELDRPNIAQNDVNIFRQPKSHLSRDRGDSGQLCGLLRADLCTKIKFAWMASSNYPSFIAMFRHQRKRKGIGKENDDPGSQMRAEADQWRMCRCSVYVSFIFHDFKKISHLHMALRVYLFVFLLLVILRYAHITK